VRRLVRTCRSLYRSSPSRAFSWLVTPMTPKYTTAPPHTCATLSNRRDVSTSVLTKKQKCRVTWRAEHPLVRSNTKPRRRRSAWYLANFRWWYGIYGDIGSNYTSPESTNSVVEACIPPSEVNAIIVPSVASPPNVPRQNETSPPTATQRLEESQLQMVRQ